MVTVSEVPTEGDPQPREKGVSVLGNLPRTRPGVRSPRRDRGTATAQAGERSRTPRTEERLEGSSPSLPGSVEELARTGIGVAAGAVTLGLRIAGRAADTIRGAVERR